jgi:xanthine dehydrogenase accessory factor
VAEPLFGRVRTVIRGGGDLGSGVAYRLHRCGFPVLITELDQPLLVRRAVAFGSAAIEGEVVVEGITARRVVDVEGALSAQAAGEIPVLVDPEGQYLGEYDPSVLVDARMLKRPPGAQPVGLLMVIGLGPGFVAPLNCDAAVETNRGHYLGRVIWDGAPEADTGLPGRVGGHVADRVLRAPVAGEVSGLAAIGDAVEEDQLIVAVGGVGVRAPFDGVLRGLVHDGITVPAGAKIGDVDPRGDPAHCFTISEKALAIGGGVLEAILSYRPIQELIAGHLA